MKRWTMKELEEVTDKVFILDALLERKGRCTNYYSPLAMYIKKLIHRVANYCPDYLNDK